jgi:hypothetical protein
MKSILKTTISNSFSNVIGDIRNLTYRTTMQMFVDNYYTNGFANKYWLVTSCYARALSQAYGMLVCCHGFIKKNHKKFL